MGASCGTHFRVPHLTFIRSLAICTPSPNRNTTLTLPSYWLTNLEMPSCGKEGKGKPIVFESLFDL